MYFNFSDNLSEIASKVSTPPLTHADQPEGATSVLLAEEDCQPFPVAAFDQLREMQVVPVTTGGSSARAPIRSCVRRAAVV